MAEWKSMESAPRDGTQVLLWAASWEMTWGIQIGHFVSPSWITSEGDVQENDEGFDPDADIDEGDEIDDEANLGPTHWMPLPQPPDNQ
jgi:hypothetical protein